jgi:hypothetical protein
LPFCFLLLPLCVLCFFSHVTAVTDSVRAPSTLGRKGIGLGKRAPSPTELERLAKAAKVAEDADKVSFRDRTRREFEQRRAESRLGPAQRTCATLDERAGKEVRKKKNSPLEYAHPLSLSFFPSFLPLLRKKKKEGVGEDKSFG